MRAFYPRLPQVCLYFLNSVFDSVSTWQWSRQPEVMERARRWPQHYPAVRCAAQC